MNATITKPANGIYFLHPEGSGWTAACIRDGRCIGMTEESMMETHATAGDRWAGIVPMESDVEVDPETARLVIAAVMPGCDPEMVCVSQPID